MHISTAYVREKMLSFLGSKNTNVKARNRTAQETAVAFEYQNELFIYDCFF